MSIAMTGMRKIMEKCRSWCSKEDKAEEGASRGATTGTAYASRDGGGGGGGGDCDWSRNMRVEELLLAEMQRATCLNCNLIAMGEMLPYADGRCPRCGNMAPR